MSKTEPLEVLRMTHLRGVIIFLNNLTSKRQYVYPFYSGNAIRFELLGIYIFNFARDLKVSYLDVGAWRHVRHYETVSGVGFGLKSNKKLNIFYSSPTTISSSQSFTNNISKSQNYVIERVLNVKINSLSKIIEIQITKYHTPFIFDSEIKGQDFERANNFNFPDEKRPIIILLENSRPKLIKHTRELIHNIMIKNSQKLTARTVLKLLFVEFNSKIGILC